MCENVDEARTLLKVFEVFLDNNGKRGWYTVSGIANRQNLNPLDVEKILTSGGLFEKFVMGPNGAVFYALDITLKQLKELIKRLNEKIEEGCENNHKNIDSTPERSGDRTCAEPGRKLNT